MTCNLRHPMGLRRSVPMQVAPSHDLVFAPIRYSNHKYDTSHIHLKESHYINPIRMGIDTQHIYVVAEISRLLKIMGLFCRIYSLL